MYSSMKINSKFEISSAIFDPPFWIFQYGQVILNYTENQSFWRPSFLLYKIFELIYFAKILSIFCITFSYGLLWNRKTFKPKVILILLWKKKKKFNRFTWALIPKTPYHKWNFLLKKFKLEFPLKISQNEKVSFLSVDELK